MEEGSTNSALLVGGCCTCCFCMKRITLASSTGDCHGSGVNVPGVTSRPTARSSQRRHSSTTCMS
jgi:hypothetical protein